MAKIYPFRGLRFNVGKVGDLSRVVTPPYDVIDAEEQDRYYDRHPNNVIRLELGKTFPEDSETSNRYTRAASYLRQWIQDGILTRESEPAFYLHEHCYSVGDRLLTRTGFFAAVEVVDYNSGQVLPHEDTMAKPIEDRISLLRACRTNLSPIFALFSDQDRQIDEALLEARGGGPPVVEFSDENDHVHRLWPITDQKAVESVQLAMVARPVLIADGHHRYETALRFRQEMGGNEGSDQVLMALVNLYDPGLIILPTHRLLRRIEGFDPSTLADRLEIDFDVREMTAQELASLADPRGSAVEGLNRLLAERGREGTSFGMYAGNNRYYVLSLKPGVVVEPPRGKSEAWARLDVPVLHTLILERMLGITPEKVRTQENLSYSRDAEYCVRSVDSGEFQAAFFLNPTKIAEVLAVARRRETMPQKSTYFYPKLLTGLVLRQLGS